MLNQGGIKVKRWRLVLIVVAALLQIVPILLLPPESLLPVNRLLLPVPAVVVALFGWELLTFRPWGRVVPFKVEGSLAGYTLSRISDCCKKRR